jgi:hypothetical protein
MCNTGKESTPKWSGKQEHNGRDPKEDVDRLGKKGHKSTIDRLVNPLRPE